MHLLPCRIINQFELRERVVEEEKQIKNTRDQDGYGGNRLGAERPVGFQYCKLIDCFAVNNKLLLLLLVSHQMSSGVIKVPQLCFF